jgi:predicted dehydrogenase
VSELIRVALLGYGLAGSVFHAPLVSADPRYALRAIVTGNEERAAAAADRYPHAEIVADADAVFDRAAEFDLVIVAAPTPLHAELAGRAIEHGLSAVVDKPLAVHVDDAERLIAEAESAGVLLLPFQNRRWDGDFLTVARLIDEGAFGAVNRFESRFEWLNPRARPAWKSGTTGPDGGGVAYDLGAHLVDQAIRLFGPVRSFYGELDSRRTGAVNDDDSFIALTHESGVRSHLAMSSLVAQRGFRFRVLGSDSAFTKWGLDPQESQLAARMSPLDDAFGREPDALRGRLGRDDDYRLVPTDRGRYPEFYAGLAAAIQGNGSVPVDPRDALQTLRIIEELHSRAS